MFFQLHVSILRPKSFFGRQGCKFPICICTNMVTLVFTCVLKNCPRANLQRSLVLVIIPRRSIVRAARVVRLIVITIFYSIVISLFVKCVVDFGVLFSCILVSILFCFFFLYLLFLILTRVSDRFEIWFGMVLYTCVRSIF